MTDHELLESSEVVEGLKTFRYCTEDEFYFKVKELFYNNQAPIASFVTDFPGNMFDATITDYFGNEMKLSVLREIFNNLANAEDKEAK